MHIPADYRSEFNRNLTILLVLIVAGILLGGVVGAAMTTTSLVGGFLLGLQKTSTLAVLESSMSLDNAVIVSKLLEKMDFKWRKVYMTLGLIIGVVFMRFSFPILIVSFTTETSPWTTLLMAIHKPEAYSQSLISHQNQIDAFGGSFLLLIALNYFMGEEKGEDHWIKMVEAPLAKLGNIASMPLILTITVLLFTSIYAPVTQQYSYVIAGMCGIFGYYIVKDFVPVVINAIFGSDVDGKTAMTGVGGFIYIECIDSSFSFDGVIGAFAITNNIFQIAIGLGIGALCIRFFTVVSLRTGAISGLDYLENGAFLSILFLTFTLFSRIRFEVPDYITGGVSAMLIIAAYIASIKANKEKSNDEQVISIE